MGNVRLIQLASAALAASGLLAGATASAQGVKIGILNDQSGTYADYGGKGSIEAAKMAIEDFGGSVLGQTIDMVTADHQNKPDLAGNIARRWYDAEGVDMITDLTTSSVALAVQGIAAEKKKIDIVVGAATSAITGSACTPYGFHWAFDTHALAVSTGGALVKTGGDTWYFVTVDYAFGHALEKDTSAVIEADGGKVLGHVLYPLNAPDFSSFLLQAQSSKAKIVGLANAGTDTVNSIKQAAEFGIVAGGQRLAALLMTAGGGSRPRTGSRAGSGADRELLLGPQRPDARIRRTLLQTHRADAEHDPGRHLFSDPAISQGGEGRRHEGRGCGGEEAEGAAGRRRLHVAWACAGQWPHGVGPLSVPGQEAVGEQTRLGLL